MSKSIVVQRLSKGLFNTVILVGAGAAGLATSIAAVPIWGLGTLVTGSLATSCYVGFIAAKQKWK